MSVSASADNDWLHIYTSGGKLNTGELNKVESVQFHKSEKNDTLYEKMEVTRDGKPLSFNMADIDSCVIGTNVPTITIDIENGAEVQQKEVFLNAHIKIDGYGKYDDFEGDMQIRGRGNSTWNMSKKPYRIKFEKKQALFGMNKAKNYALIANMIDCTLMRNTIALTLGQMLEMPYTNHAIPVNVIINGTYRGSYIITEKIGINSGSVDIDETQGILFEMDTNYDEDYKFYSSKFKLPVMVKDPDFKELFEKGKTTIQPSDNFNKWKADFEAMEATLSSNGGAPSADFANKLDINSLVDYLLIYNLTGNHEPHHPKSVYLHKANADDIYHMGPIWDFDWAYTFDDAEGRGNPESYLFSDNSSGSNFFKAACRDAKFKARFAER